MNDWMMHPTFSKIPTNENINHNDHVTERSLHKTTAYRFQCPSLRDSHSFLPHRPWRGSTLEFAWRKVIGNTSSLSQITLWTVTVTLTRTQRAQNQKREKAKKIKISNKNWKKKTLALSAASVLSLSHYRIPRFSLNFPHFLSPFFLQKMVSISTKFLHFSPLFNF